jgi:hypothetical protein
MFLDITLPDDVAGEARTASISEVIIEPGHALSGSASKRAKSLSHLEMAKPELDDVGCPVYSKATKSWTFRVHADCWEIVACRVPDPVACATIFCKSLVSVNWGLKGRSPEPRPPRELMGATTPHGKNYRRVCMQRLDSFDGLAAEFGLDRLPTVQAPVSLEDLGLSTPNTEAIAWSSKTQDPFSALPEEILQQIVQHTPTPDLLNLRLASRSVSYVSRLANLPRGFWRSRWAPAFEMGFALPVRVDQDLDWRGMYFLTRRALMQHSVVFPRMDSPLLARLSKRRYWWEKFRRVAEMQLDWEGF